MKDAATWRCPECGSPLTGERQRLELTEDDGGVAAIYFVSCPDGHLHLAVTEPELRRFVGELICERLRQG